MKKTLIATLTVIIASVTASLLAPARAVTTSDLWEIKYIFQGAFDAVSYDTQETVCNGWAGNYGLRMKRTFWRGQFRVFDGYPRYLVRGGVNQVLRKECRYYL